MKFTIGRKPKTPPFVVATGFSLKRQNGEIQTYRQGTLIDADDPILHTNLSLPIVPIAAYAAKQHLDAVAAQLGVLDGAA